MKTILILENFHIPGHQAFVEREKRDLENSLADELIARDIAIEFISAKREEMDIESNFKSITNPINP